MISPLPARGHLKTAAATLFLLVCSTPAWALQTHTAPEGLYAHQGAHAFFIIALVSFAIRLRLLRMLVHREWRFMYWGVLLLALWNLWAFSGHIITLFIPEYAISVLETEKVPVLAISSWKEMAYYILKLDHLLSLPALLFFLLGLRAMQANFPQKTIPGERRQRERRVYY